MVFTADLLTVEEPARAREDAVNLLPGHAFIPAGHANRAIGNTPNQAMVNIGGRTATVGGLMIGGLLLPFALLADLARAAAGLLHRRP